MATPLWECIGFGGFHIDFALVLLAVAPVQKKEKIIKKKKVMEYYFSKTINDSFENAIESYSSS
jgi:hypothetical protein